MAISVTAYNYQPENVTGTVNHYRDGWLRDGVLTIQLTVSTFFKPSPDRPVIFGDPDYQTLDYINDVSGRFEPMNVGDTFEVVSVTDVGLPPNESDVNGTYVITEKISDNIVRIGTVFANTYNVTNGTIRVTDEPLGVTYNYGIIENDEPLNYVDKATGQIAEYQYSHPTQIGTSFVDMIPIGKKDTYYKESAVQVRRVSSDAATRTYVFEIKHDLLLEPIYLPSQLTSILNNEAPLYFEGINALRHVFSVKLLRDGNDPNNFLELEYDKIIGDTGWAFENSNGRSPNYEFASVAYNNTIDTLQLETATQVTITADEVNAVAGEWVTAFFFALPESSEDITNNNLYKYQNYCLDKATVQVGAGAVNGSNFGTGYQAITGLTATSAASVTTAIFTIDLGADCVTKINSLGDKRFCVGIHVLGAGYTANNSNVVPLIAPVNKFDFELTAGTVTVDFSTLVHFQNDEADLGLTDLKALTNEELVEKVDVTIDTANYTSVLLDSVEAQIIGTNGTDEIVFENYEINVASAPSVGSARLININQSTGYNVLPSEIRANYKLDRRTDLDSGTNVVYRLLYPYFIRWEYWEKINNLATLPSDLFDASQPHNGYNQDFDRVDEIATWDIKFRLKYKVTADGKQFEGSGTHDISIKDYLENPEWINENIKIFDSTPTELTYSGSPYIPQGELVTVQADFTLNSGVPTIADYFMVMFIYEYEKGTTRAIHSFSSVYNRENISVFKALGTDGLIKLSNPSGNILRGEAYIDPEKFQGLNSEYDISAYIKSRTTPAVPFSFTIDTTKTEAGSSASNQFKFAASPGVSGAIDILWGDGNSSLGVTLPQTHTYSVDGVYQIQVISGSSSLNFANIASNDRLKLISINMFGDVFKWGSSPPKFYGCANFTSIDTSDWNPNFSLASTAEAFRDTGLTILPALDFELHPMGMNAEWCHPNLEECYIKNVKPTNLQQCFVNNPNFAIWENIETWDFSVCNNYILFLSNSILDSQYYNRFLVHLYNNPHINGEQLDAHGLVATGDIGDTSTGLGARNALITLDSYTINDAT